MANNTFETIPGFDQNLGRPEVLAAALGDAAIAEKTDLSIVLPA